MMKTEIIEEQNITFEQDRKIRRLLCECFPKDEPVFSAGRYWNDVAPKWSVILKEDFDIVAQLGVVDTNISIEDESIHIAGVGNVCVHCECRGKGLSRKILVKSMKEAGKRNYDFGFLFCKFKIRELYGAVGWKVVDAPDIIRTNEDGKDEEFQRWRNDEIAMYYPLMKKHFPEGVIRLQGMNW